MRNGSTPIADLSVGSGPNNPPCPACGEPLFGWAVIRPKGEPVRRCEKCGMAVVGNSASREEALAALEATRSAGEALPNRASAQAWLGSSGWGGLNRESRLLFTPDAVQRLGREKERPGPAFVAMYQTLLNSFTFGHNIVSGASGRVPATPAKAVWQRAIDWIIAVATFIPLAVIALVLESAAWAAGGGGSLRLK